MAKKKEAPKSRMWIFWTLLALVVIFYLFPAKHEVTFINELQHPQNVNFDSWQVAGYANSVTLWLPPGSHNLHLYAPGFHNKTVNINTVLNFKKTKQLTVPIDTIYLSQEDYTFLDPTTTLQLHPKIIIAGTDVLGRTQQRTVKSYESFPAGYYDISFEDIHFSKKGELKATTLHLDAPTTASQSVATVGTDIASPAATDDATFASIVEYDFDYDANKKQTITLQPNHRFHTLTNQETQYILNFINDYLQLGAQGHTTRRTPKQFYLANKNISLSAGDMVFLYCLSQTYNQFKQRPNTFFIPKTKLLVKDEGVQTYEDCYHFALAGYAPTFIATPDGFESGLQDPINERSQKHPVAFTFDIESGRYVFDNKGPNAIKPCEGIYAKGLTQEQLKQCNDATKVAWFSPLMGTNHQKIPYPWVTGVDGTKEILEYSTKYGIPTTHFMLTKEIQPLKEYFPKFEQSYTEVLTNNLVEIASHTNTHNALGKQAPSVEQKELTASKQLLDQLFQTNVQGFRGPYLTRVGNNIKTHQKAVQQAGYTYHSSYDGEDKTNPVKNKFINIYYTADAKVQDLQHVANRDGFIVTLDHPWNIFYSEVNQNQETFLKRNATRALKGKALIFDAISEGFIPMKMQHMPTKKNS